MSQNAPQEAKQEAKPEAPKHADRIRGVFSSQEVRIVGTGTTKRRSIHKVFWFVNQNEKGVIQIQSLNTNYVPTGTPKPISKEELLEKYSPEPEFYIQSVFPKIREINESVSQGDQCREKGENFSAEFAYDKALKLDEENVRANFGIGLTYLARGETDKADNIFDRLVHLDAAFETQHKHLFNDFGINLRKNKMYKQAVEYYGRALELSPTDENLHINVARAKLEEKDIGGCVEHLLESLRLAPRNEMAVKFLSWLNQKKLVPPEFRAPVKATLAGKQLKPPEPAPDATKPETTKDQASVDIDVPTAAEVVATEKDIKENKIPEKPQEAPAQAPAAPQKPSLFADLEIKGDQ